MKDTCVICRTYSSYLMRLAVSCSNTARLCHAQSIPVLSQSNILSPLCPTTSFPKSFSWWNTKRPLDNFGSFLRLPAIALVCSFIHAEDACKRWRSPGIDSEESIRLGLPCPGWPVRQIGLSYQPARLGVEVCKYEPWIPLKVYRYGLC